MRNRCAILAVGLLLYATPATASTIITIGLDDGWADGLQAASMLQARDMRATFFVISGYLGKSQYLTAEQIRSLQAAGHEIGCHTVTHPDLSYLPPDEAQREICDSRSTLLGLGLDVRSFSYPYGSHTASIEQMVAQCGFNSARSVGPLADSLPAETVPPLSAFAIRTRRSIERSDSLAEIQRWIEAAEVEGGWLSLVFHRICDTACDRFSISSSDFGALLDWIAARQVIGTVVMTENEVIGGALQPAVPGPPPTQRASDELLLNSSLEELDASGVPVCWQRVGWGDHTSSWSDVGSAHDGSHAQQFEVANYMDGVERLVPAQDLGHCAPPGIPGHRYLASGYYKASAPPIWVFTYRDPIGQWRWWTESAPLPIASSWTPSTFTTPPLPADASAVSFGLSLYAAGTVAVDQLSLRDLGAEPPNVTLTSPSQGSFVRGTVGLAATASSPFGIDRVDFSVGGVVLATVTAEPFSAPWDSTTYGDGPLEVTARAYDTSGNSATSTSSVTVANDAGLLLNGSLEVVGTDGTPGCWQRVSWGDNSPIWSQTSDAHAGLSAQRLDVGAYTGGGNRLMPTLDGGTCAPPALPGRTYKVTGWYKSTVQPRLVFNYRGSNGKWRWWTESRDLPAASGWKKVTFTTPALPEGATAVSFGITLYGTGSLIVDDFELTAE